MAARSYLYVPGDNWSMLERAAQRGADALILDLEDAVAMGSKDEARDRVTSWIAEYASDAGCEIWVRVNSGPRLAEDISAVLHPALAGIVLPKATASAVGDADAALSRAERAAALGVEHTPVAALIESARGLLDLRAIAEHPRVSQLALGEADLSADLGIDISGDESTLQPFRLDVVVVSAAADKAAPMGPVSTQIRDVDAFRVSTSSLRRIGFRSRQAIHPNQVQVINEVFTPTADELFRARQLVQRFEAATQAGLGVITDDEGRMVDEAVVRLARQTLELSDHD